MALLVARGASCHGLQELHRIATSLLGLGIEGDVARRFERILLRIEVRKILQKGLHVIFILGLSAVMHWCITGFVGLFRVVVATS